MTQDHYPTAAQSYLRRARDRILEGTTASLFYAAFELRACIEARVVEYAETLPHIKGKKITSWQLAKAKLALQRAVPDRRYTVMTIKIGDAQHTVAHTPIPNDVWKNVGKLGDYLHYRHDFDDGDREHLLALAHLVLTVYKDAWIACRGDLIGPLLGRGKPGSQVTTLIRLDSPDALAFNEIIKKAVAEETPAIMGIEYPDELPGDWDFDLPPGFNAEMVLRIAARDAGASGPS